MGFGGMRVRYGRKRTVFYVMVYHFLGFHYPFLTASLPHVEQIIDIKVEQ
jgi:hypothetical protein